MRPWCFPLLLAAAVFGIHVWLFSDTLWVEAILAEHAKAAARSGEDAGGEEGRQAMKAALDSGVIGVLLGIRGIWTLARSHLIFWGIAFPVICLSAGRWDRLREMWFAVGDGAWVLVVGVVMNALLRWLAIRMQATWSPAFFLDWFDGRILFHDLAIKADLFLMIYLWRIARRWSLLLAESASLIGGIAFLVWLLATFLAHALAYSFALTF